MQVSEKRRRCVTTVLFASLGLLVAVGMTGCRPSKQKTIAFDPQPPDPTRVAQVMENDTNAIKDYTPSAAAENVIKAFTALNVLTDTRAQPLNEAAIEKTFEDLNKAATRCLEAEGPENLRRLGLYLLMRFERDLDDLLKSTHSVKLNIASLLTQPKAEATVEPVYVKFIEIGGDFLPLAATNDLVRNNPAGGILVVPDTAFFVRLAFKVRWANTLPEQIEPMKLMLTDFEREQYARWVLERSKTAPLARRLQAIADLKTLIPAFFDLKAKGIALYLAGSYDEAVKAFEEAQKQHPEDKDLEVFIGQARRKK